MKNTYLYIIVILVALSSCTKVIELDLNEEENKKIVVDAIFSTYPQEHEIKLSMSANYYSADAPQQVTGATVSISDGVNTFPFTETAPGIYKSAPNAQATFETNHYLTINYNGQTYTATNYCDTVPAVDTVILEPNYVEGSTTEIKDYTIRFSTQELPGFGDNYAWKIYVNGVLRNDTIAEQISQNDEYWPDGTYFYQVALTNIDNVQSGDTITLAQHAISKETYDAFYAILYQTQYKGGIFDAPPANIPTNLSEGAIGMFSVSGETRNYAIVP